MFKRSIAVLVALSALMLATGWLTLAQEEAASEDTAQQTLRIDVEATGGLTRDGYISKLTVGALLAQGVHLSANGSMNQEGFGGGSTTLKLDMSLFSLESKASFNEEGGFTGAEFKGQASITEQIQMSGKGAVSDTGFQSGVLSFTEALSGFNLKLDTMWSGEGLDNAALSGKKTLDLYTVSAKASDLLGETPTLNATIQTLTEPVAYSWNGTITMDGLQEQTVGASGVLEQVALSGSVSLDGAGNVSLMTAGAKLSQEGLTLEGNVGFTFEGYQNATVKFQYGSEAPSVSADGEFKFNQEGLTSGNVNAQVGVADGWTLLSDAALSNAGLQQANVGVQTVLAGANTRVLVTLTPDGYTGSSLFVQYPWEGMTFTGVGNFDTEGYTLLQLTANTSFDLM